VLHSGGKISDLGKFQIRDHTILPVATSYAGKAAVLCYTIPLPFLRISRSTLDKNEIAISLNFTTTAVSLSILIHCI
jgi:hypothetical protein